MSKLLACPDQHQLVNLSQGKVPRPDLERLSEHVEGCPVCQERLHSLDVLPDPLLVCLRQPERNGGEAPVPGHLLDALQKTVPGLPEPGRRYGKFELVERLGMGSFGQVFRALDTELERVVALKIPRPGTLADASDTERFLREARSVARLHHPGIVALHEIGQAGDTCFLVEEFICGQTLAQLLVRRSLPHRDAAELLIAVAEALHYAHQHGIIHRDLKPANIMIDEQGRPHVMDFGLAKRDRGGADELTLTLEGQVLGTPAYMSPEQARGDSHQVDARSDVYSLGVILYELLTGERPFRGNRRMLLLQVLEDDPRPLRLLNDKVPRDLETICLKALARTPARRYGSAAELADDLRRWLAGEPIRARPIGWVERLGRWCGRNPLVASLFLAVTLGSAFGLAHLSKLSTDLVRSAALESAAQHSKLLEMVNSRYSSEVVERVQNPQVPPVVLVRTFGLLGAPCGPRPYGALAILLTTTPQRGLPVVADYWHHAGAIPLPATFTIDLGKQLAQQDASGVQVRLYSDYPFKTRTDGGPHDDFESEALSELRMAPDQPYFRFEQFQGKPVLRYAIARRMEATCLGCHNYLPESRKKDWKVGDVRGVLEIIRPLDSDIERTHKGLRGTFLLVSTIAGVLLAVGVGAVVLGQRRGRGRLPQVRSGE
jgi:serine/threonine protein kinase